MYGKKNIYGGGSDMREGFRPGRTMEEVLVENVEFESRIVGRIRALFTRRDMAALGAYLDELKAEGWSAARVDSLVNRATFGKL